MSVLALAHIGFVIGAYAVTVLVIAFLIAWIALDQRALRRALKPYESQSRGLRDLDGVGP